MLTLPAGTGFAGYNASSVVDDSTGLRVGACGTPVGLTVTCPLSAGAEVHGAAPAGDLITVVLHGITNTSSRSGLIWVSTTSQAKIGPFPIATLAPNHVSTPTVTLGGSKAGETTSYSIGFRASSSGGLSGAADSAIILTFPQGTGFGSYQSGSVVDETTGAEVGSCGYPPAEMMVCQLSGGATVNGGNPPPKPTPGDAIGIVLTGVTNPASGTYNVSVSTTSDVMAATSAGYTVG
jgi:hypothetical protein